MVQISKITCSKPLMPLPGTLSGRLWTEGCAAPAGTSAEAAAEGSLLPDLL